VAVINILWLIICRPYAEGWLSGPRLFELELWFLQANFTYAVYASMYFSFT
jgi:hypothetical protein